MADWLEAVLVLVLGLLLGGSQAQPCQPVKAPMCNGLVGYTHTRLPRGQTQAQTYVRMDPLWPFIDMGCSSNLRLMTCAFYLPQCPPGNAAGAGWQPCKETCQRARRCRRVMKQMKFPWPRDFNCNRLRPMRTGRCVPPVNEGQDCNRNHVTCSRNTLPFCQNLPFSQGASPNMFLQCNASELRTEVLQFRPLIASNCHPGLRFFLCGLYQPYCVRANIPFALPCRELCEEIKEACEAQYTRLYDGLPWPSKFQCHRYPATGDQNFRCVMPSDSPSVLSGGISAPESSASESESRSNDNSSRNNSRNDNRRRRNRRDKA